MLWKLLNCIRINSSLRGTVWFQISLMSAVIRHNDLFHAQVSLKFGVIGVASFLTAFLREHATSLLIMYIYIH